MAITGLGWPIRDKAGRGAQRRKDEARWRRWVVQGERKCGQRAPKGQEPFRLEIATKTQWGHGLTQGAKLSRWALGQTQTYQTQGLFAHLPVSGHKKRARRSPPSWVQAHRADSAEARLRSAQLESRRIPHPQRRNLRLRTKPLPSSRIHLWPFLVGTLIRCTCIVNKQRHRYITGGNRRWQEGGAALRDKKNELAA